MSKPQRTWGVTRFPAIDDWLQAATATCLARMYSNSDLVRARPPALKKAQDRGSGLRTRERAATSFGTLTYVNCGDHAATICTGSVGNGWFDLR